MCMCGVYVWHVMANALFYPLFVCGDVISVVICSSSMVILFVGSRQGWGACCRGEGG